MNHYFVYILLCSDGSYYTGVTNNVENRLYEHQSGSDPKSYTHKRRPVRLLFHETFYNINQDVAFEKQVKGWSRAKKEAVINGNWDLLPGLSKNNQTPKE